MSKRNIYIGLLLFIFWLMALVSKLEYNGLVYGLDFGLYHPDGALYTFRTFMLLGHTQLDSGTLVSQWYQNHALKGNFFTPQSLFFENNSNWLIYKSRILYPLFSVPFVAIFGIPGMLAVPAISLLILMIVTLIIAHKYQIPIVGLVLAIAFSLSSSITRWMFSNITDGLLVAILSIVVLLLLLNNWTWLNFCSLLICVILTGLTRFSFFLWIAVAIVLYFNNRKLLSLMIVGISSLFIVPVFVNNLGYAVLPSSGNVSILHKIAKFPSSMLKVGIVEIAEIAILDRLLLIMLALSIILSLKFRKELSSQFFLFILLSLWITGSINGTLGVNFRYQLPILPFISWVLITHSIKFMSTKKITNL